MLKSLSELLKELEGVKFTRKEMEGLFDKITKSPREMIDDI